MTFRRGLITGFLSAALVFNHEALAQHHPTPHLRAGTVIDGPSDQRAGKAPSRPCSPRTTSIYVGAITGAMDLASAANVPNLQIAGNVGFYLTSYALTQVAGLNLASIQANWANHAPGILEVGTDPVNMPDIASTYAAQIAAVGWTWGTINGTAWPAVVAASGWHPHIAMLNPFAMGLTGSLTDPYYRMNLAAIADIKAAAPSIKYVIPYITPNGAVSAAIGNTRWSSTPWAEYRALAQAAGGLGLDTPSNYFSSVRDGLYRNLVVQEIHWANANGLLSAVLLSPYHLGAAAGTIPQFQYDPSFFEATQREIAYLRANNANPTFFFVVNYSEGAGTNPPGRDTAPETINATALWVAHKAVTTPPTAGFRATQTAAPAWRHGLRCEAAAPM